MPKPPTTGAALQAEIEKILRKRALEASSMAYDKSVWIGAVAAARQAYERVLVVEPVTAYHGAVVAALSHLSETYNDSDGEYTNGRGGIGDVLYDVMGLFPAR